LVCARLDTTPRCGVPCRSATAVSNCALVKPKKCHSSNESCGGIRTPLSSTRGRALRVSRERSVACYGPARARQMRSHLEQVGDTFSSCESRNFPPAWGCPGSQPRPVPVSGGVPHDGQRMSARFGHGVGCFVLKWTISASAAVGRQRAVRALCVHKGAQCCAAVTIFRRAIHPFVDC